MATLEHEVTRESGVEIGIRVSREQADRLERAASMTGQSLGEFAASALLGAAETALTAPLASPPVQASAAGWHKQNDRRMDLIFKERDHSLTSDEQAELGRLQAEMERRVNRRQTLDFDALAEWEQAVQRVQSAGDGPA